MPPDLLSDFEARGLVHQCTDAAALRSWLATPGRRVYAGFDPTADSLHVGHLVALVLLRRVAAAGHEPVALVGGATGMIGDPSGRSEERNLLSPAQLAANVAGVERQIRRILESAGQAVHVVNNGDWMQGVGYLAFLRDVGKHVPLSQMLGKDSVKSRLERDSGLSYTEFSYMLLQAWDFVHLSDALDCRLQIGGSDQWGNITAGIELGRRLRSRELYGITCPLLVTSDGTKMGKTAAGAVWLDPKRTSPYRFYQYWINLEDEDAGRCLRRLTETTPAEWDALETSRRESPAARETQKRLAEELTRLVHGDDGLTAARQATAIFFGAEIGGLDDDQLAEIFADVPSCEFPRSSLDGEGLPLIDALVKTQLAATNTKARQTIAQGGAYVNNRRIGDVAHRLSGADLAGGSTLVLRSGKKSYAVVRFTPPN
ncbi:MAG: tyrosine--tRNA ligase [Planctomycetota bacterium]|nr:MAG: tyrosine--tRNA ligase [Planctomycetota bacterium]